MRTKFYIILIIALMIVSMLTIYCKFYINYCNNVEEMYVDNALLLNSIDCQLLIERLCLLDLKNLATTDRDNPNYKWHRVCLANRCFPIRLEGDGQNTDMEWPNPGYKCCEDPSPDTIGPEPGWLYDNDGLIIGRI